MQYRWKNPDDQGNLHPGMLPIMDYLNKAKGFNQFTAGNDAYHKKHSKGSYHNVGRGLDFTINDPSQADSFIEQLQTQPFGGNIKLLNEYDPNQRSKNATGGHIHLSYYPDGLLGSAAQPNKGLLSNPTRSDPTLGVASPSGVTSNTNSTIPTNPVLETNPMSYAPIKPNFKKVDQSQVQGLIPVKEKHPFMTPGQTGLMQMAMGLLGNHGGTLGQNIAQSGLLGLAAYQGAQDNLSDQEFRDARIAKYNSDLVADEQKRSDEQAKRDAFMGIDWGNLSREQAAQQMFALNDVDNAVKLMGGQNTVDPYFTPISTESGLMGFDNRTNKITPLLTPDNKPIIKSADSPMVRGNIAGAEAQAKVQPAIQTHAANTATDAQTKLNEAKQNAEPHQNSVNDLTKTMRGFYNDLYQQGGVNSSNDGAVKNITNYMLRENPLAQKMGDVLGTDAASSRNKITQTRQLLVQEIAKSSGMTAGQMNSDRELQNLIDAATNPDLGLEANQNALDQIDKLHGVGGTATLGGKKASQQPTQRKQPIVMGW